MTAANRHKLLFAAAAITVIALVVYVHWDRLSQFRYGVSFELTESGAVVLERVWPASAAAQAGLATGDVVRAVDGRGLGSDADLVTMTASLRRQQSAEFEIVRPGGPLSVQVDGRPQSLNPGEIISLLLGITYMVMGCWVFLARPQYVAARAWGYFSLCMGGIIAPSGYSYSGGGFLERLIIGLALGLFTFSAAAILHFSLVFPRPGRLAKKKSALIILYAIPSLLWLLILFDFLIGEGPEFFAGGDTPTAFIITIMLVGYYLLYMFLAIVNLLLTYLRTGDVPERLRIRWITLGTALPIAYLLAIVVLENVFGLVDLVPSWSVFLALLVIPVANFYAIVRYRAMQFGLIIRKGLVYSLVTGIVLVLTVAVFASAIGFLLFVQGALPAFAREGSPFYSLVSNDTIQKTLIAVWAVFVGATIVPLKRRMQDFVDRRFHREKYNYKQALHRLTTVLENITDRDRLLEIVLENAEQLVHPRGAAVMLVGEGGTGCVERAEPPSLRGAPVSAGEVEALRAHFSTGPGYLGLRELREEGRPEAETAGGLMQRLEADICLPLRIDRRIAGFLLLGPRRSEVAYSLEDLELLKLLADQAGHGLDHLRLAATAAERESIRREMEISRQIQRSFLPDAPPQINGCRIAALNIPMAEVGGDFYTFIEYGPSRVGIIVGDIVGKGVPGALNMAATISSIRLIAEEGPSVAETMLRLNRFLVRNTGPRSFAAVLFAILDTEAKTMRWSNAGLPDPVLIPASGPARFLEAREYSFPPGASLRSNYVESEHTLLDGDTVVFITDGAVEIRPLHSPDQEFGFDGILRTLESAPGAGAEDRIGHLVSELKQFHGSESLEDDLTAVAVRIGAE